MKKNEKRKRPLSHNPLLNFYHDDNFLYSNPKFMNEELWKRKYNLRKLHEKWKRKLKTNFLNIDHKFDSLDNKNNKINKIIYKDNNSIIKDIYNMKNIFCFSPLMKKRQEISLYNNDKYNDKISYYLFNKNPWDNRISINNNLYNIKEFNKINEDIIIKNNLKNTNEAKNIKVKCNYYNNKYIKKNEKLKELINRYINEIKQIIEKKYKKEIKLKYKDKENFKNYLIFKEMIIKYKELYEEIIQYEIDKYLKYHKNIKLKKSNSEINIHKIKNKEIIENNNIYEELYIIINYIKENKDIINTQKDKEFIVKNYFDIIEKDEYLRDKNINYQKYIINFTKNINVHLKQKDEPYYKQYTINKKYNGSSLNLMNNSNKKKKNLEYIISFYHPGTYFLFNNGENEYHAWSCCMNENKNSKGCSKKIEKKEIFNYDIII